MQQPLRALGLLCGGASLGLEVERDDPFSDCSSVHVAPIAVQPGEDRRVTTPIPPSSGDLTPESFLAESHEDAIDSTSLTLKLAENPRFLDIPHVRQSFKWDCGIACVQMILW